MQPSRGLLLAVMLFLTSAIICSKLNFIGSAEGVGMQRGYVRSFAHWANCKDEHTYRDRFNNGSRKIKEKLSRKTFANSWIDGKLLEDIMRSSENSSRHPIWLCENSNRGLTPFLRVTTRTAVVRHQNLVEHLRDLISREGPLQHVVEPRLPELQSIPCTTWLAFFVTKSTKTSSR